MRALTALTHILALSAVGAAHAAIVGPDVRVSPSDGIEANDPLVATAGSHALAAWAREGSFIYISYVGTAYSTDAGATWTLGPELPFTSGSQVIWVMPTVIARDPNTFYVASLLSQGGLTVAVWRGNVSGGGLTWSAPVVALPVGQFTVDTPSLACDPGTGHLYLVVTRASPMLAGHADSELYDAWFTRSLDGGQTWEAPQVLGGPSAQGTKVVVGVSGAVHVFWVDYATSRFVGRTSTDHGASFGPEFVVATMNDNVGTIPPGFRTTSDREHPIYRTLGRSVFMTYPSVADDRSDGPRRGTLYVTWAEHGTGTPADATGFVGDPEPNDTPETAAQLEVGHDFAGSVIGKGVFDCDWYYVEAERGTTMWLRGGIGVSPPYDDFSSLPVIIYCGAGTGDEVWPTAGLRATDHHMPQTQYGPGPPTIYTLPATGRYNLWSLCANGPYAFSYGVQFRRYDIAPGEAARDHRDIVLVSSSDGGVTWSPKVRVNDDPPGNENVHASVAVDGLGQVHVAWYDRRDDPTCTQRVHTYWAMSRDGGQTFEPSQRLSSQSSDWYRARKLRQTSNIGDHLGIAAAGSTAIAVAGFEAEPRDGAIHLRWQVVDGRELAAFRLHRARDGDPEAPLGEAPIAADREGEFTVTDDAVESGRSYRYRLEVERTDGARFSLGPLAVVTPAAISRLAWERIEPNPFADRARLTLAVPRAAWATVRVFDLQGHEVRTLHRGALAPGRATFEWDGRDRSTSRAAPGIYLVRAELEGESATQRLVHVR
jgi:hypothetical protein